MSSLLDHAEGSEYVIAHSLIMPVLSLSCKVLILVLIVGTFWKNSYAVYSMCINLIAIKKITSRIQISIKWDPMKLLFNFLQFPCYQDKTIWFTTALKDSANKHSAFLTSPSCVYLCIVLFLLLIFIRTILTSSLLWEPQLSRLY